MKARDQTTKLPSKLGKFAAVTRIGSGANQTIVATPVPDAPGAVRPAGGGRGRIKEGAASVGVTLRMAREDWMRVHELALREGVSINTLALEGISQMLRAKGLDPLQGGRGA